MIEIILSAILTVILIILFYLFIRKRIDSSIEDHEREVFCEVLDESYKKMTKPLTTKDRLFLSKTGVEKSYSSINRLNDGNNDHQFFLMVEGFKTSAFMQLDSLIDDKRTDWLDLDSKIFPIIFTFRQYLELILKQTLRLERLLNKEIQSDELGFKTIHLLKDLWNDLKPYIKSRYKNYDQKTRSTLLEQEKIIDGFIDEIEGIDAGSYAFRYPFKKSKRIDEKVSFSLLQRTIDLENFRENAEKLSVYLEGINEQARVELDQQQTIP